MDTELIDLIIDDVPVRVPAGTTILEAAKTAGVEIRPSSALIVRFSNTGTATVRISSGTREVQR